METNELNKNARGGTELLMERLHSAFPDIHEEFQIIPSRVREIDLNRKLIYYLHDLPNDPEVAHLKDGGWNKFDKLVFVSYWQQQMYNIFLGVPYSKGVVIPNSVDISKTRESVSSDKIKLIYHTTPHRGLDILAEVFLALQKDFKNSIELHVYSSFDLYGWEERDKPFQDLFKKLQDTENVTYSKSVSNEKIREILPQMDIFAYPSTWVETSCLCLIEAMASNLDCIHSSLGALPETSGMTTDMYGFSEDRRMHAELLYDRLHRMIRYNMDDSDHAFFKSKSYTHVMQNHNWKNVQKKWDSLFKSMS